MKKNYFEWKTYRERYGLQELPDIIVEDGFILSLEEKKLYLSKKLSYNIFKNDRDKKSELTTDEAMEILKQPGAQILREDLRRLKSGKSLKTESHVDFVLYEEAVMGLITMVKIPNQPYVLGMVYLCYGMMHEHKLHLDQVIKQLEQAQNINQLILEGSTDYIYQLDLVNNTCTFSPKAMDVLPLESPTFGNAMDRVLSFIVPEDRSVFLESFSPFLTGKSLYHTAEYRVNTKQGDIMWISCHGKGLLDSEGRPLMIAGSLIDITEQKNAQENIYKMLHYDILTGLKNRYCYEEEMEEYLGCEGASGSIVCVDIHNFKLFNEMFGHNFGNKILKEFADMLRVYFPDTLGIYRLEGDEFLIHLKENSRDIILERLAPFRIAVSKVRILEGHSIYIDVTMGVAIYPEHGSSPDQLLKNADTILYRMSRNESKDKDRVMFFTNKKGTDIFKRYSLENELRNDIENQFQHFRVVYQPVVKLSPEGNYWCAAEALLRYSNPAMPGVGQMELISTLEESDLIVPVGRWVLQQAISECSQWKKIGANATVHVNFSAQQLSDAGLLNFLRDTFAKNSFDPSGLVCELTETSLINNFDSATSLCRELMDMKVGIALDDFGTGYSSFNYLRNLPISQIKVDKAYVQNLKDNDYNWIIINCLYNLSQNMSLELCVEGVETAETLEILSNMGVSLIQGFYFERPLEAEVVRKEFQNHIYAKA